VILRDPLTQRGLPILLTSSEANALREAFHAWRDANGQPYPQDLSQRLLESFGAQLQRVMINALAGQTLYATVTMTQGTQTREVDMRLSEALILAARMGTPIFITNTLFDTATTLDLTVQASTLPVKESLNNCTICKSQSQAKNNRLMRHNPFQTENPFQKSCHQRYSSRSKKVSRSLSRSPNYEPRSCSILREP
jgi:bifunctional DNase/RNase